MTKEQVDEITLVAMLCIFFFSLPIIWATR
jgi:hypothetical protein